MSDAHHLEHKLLAAAEKGHLEKVNSLLDQGVDVLFQDEQGMSALMKAAEGGNAEVVATLLEAGCPWNLLDKDGYCAGEYAAGHPDIIEMLMNWGVQAELLLGASVRQATASSSERVSNADYLQQKLHYDDDKLLDADGEAVMMGWEKPLMEHHAAVICAQGGDVLNIGFGLGLVDEAIQRHSPASHTIIEAHPDVYEHAVSRGWANKPNVKLIKGRWQDVLPQLGKYNGIFFDTYGEYYEEMRDFHEHLPKLLKPGGVYSFFNGLAPDNLFFHLVMGRLVQLELGALSISTTYTPINVKALDDTVWEGVTNKYWHRMEKYWLPTCTYVPSEQPTGNA